MRRERGVPIGGKRGGVGEGRGKRQKEQKALVLGSQLGEAATRAGEDFQGPTLSESSRVTG